MIYNLPRMKGVKLLKEDMLELLSTLPDGSEILISRGFDGDRISPVVGHGTFLEVYGQSERTFVNIEEAGNMNLVQTRVGIVFVLCVGENA